jgi:indole-3-glycerol phosphate synthase
LRDLKVRGRLSEVRRFSHG